MSKRRVPLLDAVPVKSCRFVLAILQLPPLLTIRKGSGREIWYVKVKIRCSKFECRKNRHFETQPVAQNATPRPPAGN